MIHVLALRVGDLVVIDDVLYRVYGWRQLGNGLSVNLVAVQATPEEVIICPGTPAPTASSP